MTREEAIQTTVKALEGIPGTFEIIQELTKKEVKYYYKVRIPKRVLDNVNKAYIMKDYNMIYGEQILYNTCNQEYIVITENPFVAKRICGYFDVDSKTVEVFLE